VAESDKSSSATVVVVAQDTQARWENETDCVEYLEFKSMQPPEGLYVKNTFKFVDKTKNVHIMPYDMLVSFDVEALFPSMPVDEGLKLLKKWL
jgi:hypothetical protein